MLWRNGFVMKHIFQRFIWYCFFLVKTRYFIYLKKAVTRKLQHFYHKEAMKCWKCEFDTGGKIENYNHHDGEQLLFYKKVHIKTQSKKKDVLYIIALYYCKKRRTPIYLIKTVPKRNLKRTLHAIIQNEENWLGWIVIEQVNYC